MIRSQRQKKKRLSERGRIGGIVSQARQRERRDFLASHDPIVTGRVMRRIIDIDERTGTMTEIVIRDFDSAREVRRKLLAVGLTLSTRRVA
jgi:hypothetical protein